jgi:7-cyano-7-deazaguanine reductase
MKPEKLKDRRFDIGGVELIGTAVLETLPYDHQPQDTETCIDTREFTCVCPWSGLPDFGTLRLSYFPENLIIELKSFKYYLHSFRNVGIYQEDAVNRILLDFWSCVKPKYVRIELDYEVRGGIHQICTVERGTKPLGAEPS